jgi:hypothetical protein
MGGLDLIRPALIAVISLCALERAHAQSIEAETLFRDAERLETAGKLTEACDAFEASNRLEPRAGTLIRLGQCREKTGRLASAWSAYKDALVRVKDPRKREFATGRIAELEPKLSKLTVAVPDDRRTPDLVITRNGQRFDSALWNRALPVDGGDYLIEGRAPGHKGWAKTATVPAEGGDVVVELFVEDTPKPAEGEPLAGSSGKQPAASLDERQGWFARMPPRRKLALGLGGGGAIAVITGATFAVLAKNKQRDGRALCPDPQACDDADRGNALIETAQRRALVANVAFAVGTAAVIGGGVLWLTGARERAPRKVAITPAAAQGQVGVVLSGRF